MMRVTRHERISSFMMTIVFGLIFAVVGAVTYWLAHRPPPEPEPVPMEFVELEPEVDFGGSLEGVVGGTAEFDSGEDGGGGGEVASDEMMVDATLTNVAAAADQAVEQTLISPDGEGPSAPTTSSAYVGLQSSSSGTGTGGGRPALGFGPGRGGGVPRELRWFIKFASENSLDEYARQLDYFRVELGVLAPDGRLVYVSNLSQRSPAKREIATAKDEQRLYFTWQGGERQDADIKLLAKAGVQVGQGRILHFYTPETENRLAVAERNYANRKAKEIRRTYFAVVKQGQGYTFEVTRQTYLQ
jgi:hypothetical protein